MSAWKRERERLLCACIKGGEVRGVVRCGGCVTAVFLVKALHIIFQSIRNIGYKFISIEEHNNKNLNADLVIFK